MRYICLKIMLMSFANLLPNLCSGNEEINSLKVSEIISIIDGDTFKVNIEGLPPVFGKNISIRIANIDTPELNGKCNQEKNSAKKAKKFTLEHLKSGETIVLKNPKRGKYFRLITEVYIDDKNLAEELLKAGLAVKYDGGKRKNWCK